MICSQSCFVGLLVTAIAGSLQAGTLLTVQVETGRGGSILVHEVRVQGRRVRMDTQGQGVNRAVLYDGEAETLFLIDEQNKTYRRINPEDAEQQSLQQTEQQEQFRERIEKRIRDLPPERQSAMRKYVNRHLRSGDEARMECRQVSEGETVGSWAADYYECFVGSRRVREVWSVPWEKAGLVAEEAAALQEFVGRGSDTPRQLGRGSGSSGVPLAAEAYPGLAVRSVEPRADGGERGHQILSIEWEDIDSTLFVVDGTYAEAGAGSFMVPVR